MVTIDDSNYELWLVRYADGELSTTERVAVEAWLAQHPAAAEELAFYNEAPRLAADTSVHYAGGQHRVAVAPLWRKAGSWAAAAAVVAALMLPLKVHEESPVAPVQVAEVVPAPLAEEAAPAEKEQMVHSPKVVEQRMVAQAEVVAPLPAADTTEEALPQETIAEPALQYVDDLIVFEEDTLCAGESVAAVYVEYTNEGIALSRLIGSFLKSNIKIQ